MSKHTGHEPCQYFKVVTFLTRASPLYGQIISRWAILGSVNQCKHLYVFKPLMPSELVSWLVRGKLNMAYQTHLFAYFVLPTALGYSGGKKWYDRCEPLWKAQSKATVIHDHLPQGHRGWGRRDGQQINTSVYPHWRHIVAHSVGQEWE